MDPMTIGLLAGGAYSYLNNQNNASEQNKYAKKQMELINNIPLPILKEYYPELYKQVVQLNPEVESAINLGPSSMENVSVDPALKSAQMNALAKLQEIGDQGGMTATDRARLSQIQAENDANLRGQQGAIQQNMASRGLAGGMSEMVARQLAAQGAANRNAQQALDVKSQAEQRALQAIMQSGQLGGQMGDQQFNQAAQIAKAKDAINQFNAQNSQNVMQRNVDGRNQAQSWNAQNAQNVANQNVGTRNQATQYNLGLAQQNYNNQIARATGQTQALQNQAQIAAQNNAAQNQLIGNLIGAGAMYYGGRK